MHIWQMVLNFDQQLHTLIAMHANLVYLVLFLVVFLEIGVIPLFFLPGNPFLFVCGAFCAVGELNIKLLLPSLIIAAILGSLLSYWLGKVVGKKFFVEVLKWPKQEALDKTQLFYEKYGEIGFLFSPFLPVIRTLAPFLAGVTQMRSVKFARSVSIGAMVWVFACVLAGYFFGNIPIIQKHLGTVTVLGLAIVIVVFLVSKVWKNLKIR
ncbi:MAG: VTT domain-containing protein [Methylotenera sp.]